MCGLLDPPRESREIFHGKAKYIALCLSMIAECILKLRNISREKIVASLYARSSRLSLDSTSACDRSKWRLLRMSVARSNENSSEYFPSGNRYPHVFHQPLYSILWVHLPKTAVKVRPAVPLRLSIISRDLGESMIHGTVNRGAGTRLFLEHGHI